MSEDKPDIRTAQGLHEVARKLNKDTEWDSLPTVHVVDENGELALIALAGGGHPATMLPRVFSQIMIGEEMTKGPPQCLSLVLEVYATSINEEGSDRREARVVYTVDADTYLVSILYREESAEWIDEPEEPFKEGEIGRMVRAFQLGLQSLKHSRENHGNSSSHPRHQDQEGGHPRGPHEGPDEEGEPPADR